MKPEPERTFADAARAYHRSKHIERRLTKHGENVIRLWEDELGHLELNQLRGEHVENMIVRLFSHLKPNTISRYLTVLLAILNDAYKRGWLIRVPHIKKPKFFDERDEHLTELEVEGLLEWAFKDSGVAFLEAAALLVLIHTGARVNELCGLVGRNFMDDGVMIQKKAGKTRDTRFIPYSARMLTTYKSGFAKGDARVFTMVARHPKGMSNRMAEVLAAGLKVIGVTRHVRVHDLRHTFAYLCGCKGIDIGDLQLLMGHANISMTMRYRGFIKSRAVSVLSKL